MLALTLSRQSVNQEDKYNSKPGELLRNANLQTVIACFLWALLDPHINRYEALIN